MTWLPSIVMLFAVRLTLADGLAAVHLAGDASPVHTSVWVPSSVWTPFTCNAVSPNKPELVDVVNVVGLAMPEIWTVPSPAWARKLPSASWA